MIMKKILSVILCVLMLFSVSATAFAAGDIAISAGTKTAKAGDTVEIPVNITSNAGFMYMKIRIVYDSENLELVSIKNGTAVSGSFSTEGNAALWDSTSDEKGTGLLVTASFKVKDSAAAGDYAVKVNFIEAWNENEDNLTAVTSDGKITVEGSSTPDTPVTPPDGESKDVYASFREGAAADTVYSVDIVWGSMEFTYTAAGEGTWNPATHSFDGGAPASWSCDTDSNKITVTNHSNADVKAALSFASESAFSSVTGSFTESSGTANDSVIELATADGTSVADAPSASAYLNLSGSLADSVTSKTVIGKATVTLN